MKWMGAPGTKTTHEFIDDGSRLTRCGKRRQFRHFVRDGSLDDVNCADCKRLNAKGARKAWRSR